MFDKDVKDDNVISLPAVSPGLNVFLKAISKTPPDPKEVPLRTVIS